MAPKSEDFIFYSTDFATSSFLNPGQGSVRGHCGEEALACWCLGWLVCHRHCVLPCLSWRGTGREMRSGGPESGKVPRILTRNPKDQQAFPVTSGMQKVVSLPEPLAGLDCWPLDWITPCCLGIINLPFCAANLLWEWVRPREDSLLYFLNWLTWRLSWTGQTGPNGKLGTSNTLCCIGWYFSSITREQHRGQNSPANWDTEPCKDLKLPSKRSKLKFGVSGVKPALEDSKFLCELFGIIYSRNLLRQMTMLSYSFDWARGRCFLCNMLQTRKCY